MGVIVIVIGARRLWNFFECFVGSEFYFSPFVANRLTLFRLSAYFSFGLLFTRLRIVFKQQFISILYLDKQLLLPLNCLKSTSIRIFLKDLAEPFEEESRGRLQ